MMEASYRRLLVGVVMVLWFFLAGCATFGPKTIPPDRFNYNEAILEIRNKFNEINS